MDRWKYFGITHRDHIVCNPTSSAKLDELVELLPLKAGSRVLDIACGKAELLLRIVHRYDATGVGVDMSPYEVEAANQRVATRNLEKQVEIVRSDGADYSVDPDSFDMAMCIGATWVWDGYLGTIEALKGIVVPDGLIAIGEPYKLKEPDPAYTATNPEFLQTLRTHAENVSVAQHAGLTLLYALVSNQDDWDRYEGMQTLAAETYALEKPDDTDVPELLKQRRDVDAEYLTWGRDTLNWAIYLFRY